MSIFQSNTGCFRMAGMMMKMMNPMGSMPSVPGTEEKDDKPEMTMAEKKEVERLR